MCLQNPHICSCLFIHTANAAAIIFIFITADDADVIILAVAVTTDRR